MSRTSEQIIKLFKVKKNSVEGVNIWIVFTGEIDRYFNRVLTNLVIK